MNVSHSGVPGMLNAVSTCRSAEGKWGHIPSNDGQSRLPCPVVGVVDISNSQKNVGAEECRPKKLPNHRGDPTFVSKVSIGRKETGGVTREPEYELFWNILSCPSFGHRSTPPPTVES